MGSVALLRNQLHRVQGAAPALYVLLFCVSLTKPRIQTPACSPKGVGL